MERLALTLWVGALWSVGYLVVPVLFAELERMQAGFIAGRLFTLVSYVGLVVGFALLFRMIALRALGWRFRVLVVMLLAVTVGQFVLQPEMAALKQSGLVPGSAEAASFARLHAESSILYLLTSLGGAFLVMARP